MTPAITFDRRSTAVPPTAFLSVPDPEQLDRLVGDVRQARPRLVDGWEATALIESLGYTDARVQRELGFSDARIAGEYLHSICRGPIGPADRWVPVTQSRARIVVCSATSTLIYAVPWLAVFVGQTINPDAVQAPTRVAPALAVALMFSLVVSGGFVQAIVRRGDFYVGLSQPRVARQMVALILRIGIATTLTVALGGLVVGWYFDLFTWPSLILGGDSFIIMSVLWMVCGAFAIRQQQWRIAMAFLTGVAAFAALKLVGADTVMALFTAAAAVLVAALVQVPQLFAGAGGLFAKRRRIPLPRLSVVAYWTAPYFWYGALYFAFLFADRLAAGTAVAAPGAASFRIPGSYTLGMELALLTLIVAASGVEVSSGLFRRALRVSAVESFTGDAGHFSALVRRHHRRALGLTLATFVVTALVIAAIAEWTLAGVIVPATRSTLLAGCISYACVVVGLLNALVLFDMRGPWTVVRTLTTALLLNLVTAYVLGHALGPFHAVDGLLLGAAYFAVASTVAVRRALQRADYFYALA